MPNTDTTLYGKWTKEEQQPETTTITVKTRVARSGDGATKPEVEMTLWQSTDPDFKVLIENAGTLTLNGSTTTPWTGALFENVRLKNDEDEPLYYFVSETEIGGIGRTVHAHRVCRCYAGERGWQHHFRNRHMAH